MRVELKLDAKGVLRGVVITDEAEADVPADEIIREVVTPFGFQPPAAPMTQTTDPEWWERGKQG